MLCGPARATVGKSWRKLVYQSFFLCMKMTYLKIYSFNVHGIRDNIKRGVVFHHLKKSTLVGFIYFRRFILPYILNKNGKLNGKEIVCISHMVQMTVVVLLFLCLQT